MYAAYSFVMTDWHDKNPNDWVAIQSGCVGKKPKLIDRDKSLMTLHLRMNGRKVTYGRAWGLGIDKDYPKEKAPK